MASVLPQIAHGCLVRLVLVPTNTTSADLADASTTQEPMIWSPIVALNNNSVSLEEGVHWRAPSAFQFGCKGKINQLIIDVGVKGLTELLFWTDSLLVVRGACVGTIDHNWVFSWLSSGRGQ
jgi:hypothetical protein